MRKTFKKDGLFAPTHIGTDKALTFPKTIQAMKNENILSKSCQHKTVKSSQQGIESDHFRLKKVMARNGCSTLSIQQGRHSKDMKPYFVLKKD